MLDIKGQVALITGGGQGLGKAICQVLAEAGAIVIVGDIKTENAQRVAEELIKNGAKAKGVDLDVSQVDSTVKAIETIKAEFGKIDILINNAGIDVTKSFAELSIEEFEKVMAVNLNGPFLMSKAVFPIMTEQGGGQIVNIVSTAAKRAWTEASAYHASKWGLLGFSHALHTEGRGVNIKVSAVVAGGMKTPFILERFPEVDQNTLQDPRNVAEAVLFVLTRPAESVIPEMMIIPRLETSWP